jgi:hypothetical protein
MGISHFKSILKTEILVSFIGTQGVIADLWRSSPKQKKGTKRKEMEMEIIQQN